MRAVLLCVALIALATNALADSATVNSAREALRLQQPARAAKLYSQALQSPNLTARERAEVLINRGLAYDQLGQPKDAVTDFTQAIALKVLNREGLAKALLDRGIALDEMGEADAAINDYTAAIAAAPDFPAALNNRGNAYRRRGDLRSARADYEASLVKGNRTPEYPLYGLGQIAEAEGNPNAALGFYRQAFAANPAFDLVAQRLAALQSGQAIKPAPGAPRPSPGSATPPQNAVASLGNEAPPLRPRIVDEPAKQGAAASGARVQLGAYRSQGEAEANWQRLISASNDLLGTLKPNIVKAEVTGKGTYYRLRTGVPDGQDAGAFCRTLQARGLDCVVVKG